MSHKSLLLKILLFGGATLSIATYSFATIVNNKLKKSAAYLEAIKIIKTEEVSKNYLGEPIVEGVLNMMDKQFYGDEGDIRWIIIPMIGQNQSGNLKYWFHSDKIKHTLLQVELLDKSCEDVIFYKKVQDEKNIFKNNYIVNKEN